MLAPRALYAAVVVGANNPELPPPFTPGSFMRYLRWAWLAQGAASGSLGKRAALALQQAQLEMRRGNSYGSSPSSWAAYSVISKE